MAIVTPGGSTTTSDPGTTSSHAVPLTVVTTLFFMWGFLTCLNDILVPHLKSIFDLNYKQSQFIQLAFFGAYFAFSFPGSKIVDWIGYQRSMVVGLLTAGLGAFLFVPAASAPSYPLFLSLIHISDAVYTDAWASMGQEHEAEERAMMFPPYQVNAELMAKAPHAVFMHCLPAHRNAEVTDAVLDGPQSMVFDQAEDVYKRQLLRPGL